MSSSPESSSSSYPPLTTIESAPSALVPLIPPIVGGCTPACDASCRVTHDVPTGTPGSSPKNRSVTESHLVSRKALTGELIKFVDGVCVHAFHRWRQAPG